MSNLKKVFSLGLAVFALAFVFGISAAKAEAATCTAEATGLWSAATTWDAACNTNTIPDADDTVVIPGNFIVTVDAAGAVAGSVSISDPIATGNNGITITSPGTLVVAGAVTFAGSTGASNSTIAVGSGSLTAASIAIADGASTGDSVLSVSTGSITTTGSGIAFTVTNIADTQLTATGAATITLGGTTGTLGAGGTVALNSASTVAFTGTGAQAVPVYTYGNLVINKATGTATLATGTVPIAGALTITEGTLNLGAAVSTVAGATTVSDGGTLAFSSATGLKTFTGDVTVASGGTWTESAAVAVTFAGNLANSGTFTADTGVHTFSGASKVLSGTLAIPSVLISGTVANTNSLTSSILLSVSGTLTNNGTVTATTELNGAGSFVNSGTLILGGTTTVTTLTATAEDNVVQYTGAGQTVKAVSYYDLFLEGSGTKTIASGITIANDLYIGSGVVAALTGASTSDTLRLAGALQVAGTWGATGVTNVNTTYFSGAGTLTVEEGRSSSGGSGGGSKKNNTPATPAVPANPDAVPSDCLAGMQFSPSTGKNCGAAAPATPAVPASSSMGSNGNAYAFGHILVKMGNKGPECKAWQMFFNAKAATSPKLVEDGHCGPKTMGVAKAWQASVGLKADGALGPMSRAKAMMQ